MGKKVLIIGGTYFSGRVFAMLAAQKGYELTFINRGRYSMKHLGENIREYKADRRDLQSLRSCGLKDDFDAVADFCAYEPGDISGLLEGLDISTKKYIYLSTADVYKRAPGPKTEASPKMNDLPTDEANLYAYKKMLLEDELIKTAAGSGFAYTLFRPAFIYGPYNYAPRESVYIRSLIQKIPVYNPVDAAGRFQMVYVKNVGEAIIAAIESSIADNKAYNLSAPEILDYPAFLELMEDVSGIKADEVIDVTVDQVNAQNLPLPFPLTEYESELFDGSLAAKELGIEYIDIKDGMKRTFNAFKPVFEH